MIEWIIYSWSFHFPGPPQEFCCYGYAIDLLEKIKQTVNFTYDLHLVADGAYGSYEGVSVQLFLELFSSNLEFLLLLRPWKHSCAILHNDIVFIVCETEK